MSNFIVLFLNCLVFTTFFIVFLDAKIGSIQKKSKKFQVQAQDNGDDLALMSDAELVKQLDELSQALPLFSNYLFDRSVAEPRAVFSLSVKSNKDAIKHLSATEKNRLFLQNCSSDVRAQLPVKLKHLTEKLSDKQIEGVAQKFTSLSAAKFLCNKMDQPKLAKFVELLPKQKKEKAAEMASSPEQESSKPAEMPPKQNQKTSMLTKKQPVKNPDKQTEVDIHAKHIHQDTDIETGSGDL